MSEGDAPEAAPEKAEAAKSDGPPYGDRLRAKLALTIDTDAFTIFAGGIERFSVEAHVWGFEAEVVFYVSSADEDDAVFPRFITTDLQRAVLSVAGHVLEGTEETSVPFSVTGYVIEKRIDETTNDALVGEPMTGRRYFIRFVDAAQAFWRQHRPLQVYSEATMATMLAEHKVTGIDLVLEWDMLDAVHDVLCLGLSGDRAPSFYDLLIWWVDRSGGVFELAYDTGKYRLGKSKVRATTSLEMNPDDVAKVALRFPEPVRYGVRVLNSFAASPQTKLVANELSVTGVRRDMPIRSPIVADGDRRAELEISRLRPPEHGIELTFRTFPDPLAPPNAVVTLDEGYSRNRLSTSKKYRVIAMHLAATRPPHGGSEDLDEETNGYQLELRIEHDLATDPVPRLPAYVAPEYPVFFEALVVSVAGEADDRTWFTIAGDSDALYRQRVEIPLFNVKIIVPFQPNRLTGQLFFPPYKGQRVLLAVDFDSANVVEYLDWATNARMPLDTQGNRIVMGQRAENGTYIEHKYGDGMPELHVERRMGGDIQTIDVTDGTILMKVREDPAVKKVEPRFDVTIQVVAAQDAVSSNVRGAVKDVSGKFEKASAGVTGKIDEKRAEVDEQLSASEATLFGKIDAAESELSAAVAGAKAAVAAIAVASESAKEELVTASAHAFDELQAKPAVPEAKLHAFLTSAEASLVPLETEVRDLDATLGARLDQSASGVPAAKSTIVARVTQLEARLRTLLPPATPAAGGTGPWAKFGQTHAEILALSPLVQATANQQKTLVAALTPELGRPLDEVAAEAESRRASALAQVAALHADAAARRGRSEGLLQQKLAAATPEGRAALVVLRTRLGAAVMKAEADERALRASLDTAFNPTRDGVEQAKRATKTSVDTILHGVDQLAVPITTAAGQLGTDLDAAWRQVAATVQAMVDPLLTQLEAAKSVALPALDQVPQAVAAARAALRQATTTAQGTLNPAIEGARTALATVERSVLDPIAVVRGQLRAADKQLAASIATVSATIDTIQKGGVTQITALLSQLQAAIDAAGQALDAVKSVVKGIRAQIMPPIDALLEKLTELTTLFNTGVQALITLEHTGVSALGAIPAEGLPKAMVASAVAAITGALKAALPPITAGAKSAGDALQSLSTTLQTQVDTAATALGTQLGTLTTTVGTQIDAVVPPVMTQVQAVQTQIDTMVTQITTQIGTAKSTCLTTITTTKTQVGTQVDTACTQLGTTIDQAKTTNETTMTTLREQIAAAKTQLGTQVDTACTQIDTQLANVVTTADTALAQVDTQAAAIEAQITAAIDAALAPFAPAIAALRTRIDGIGASVQGQIAPLRSQAASQTATLLAAVPTDDAITQMLAPVSAAQSAVFDQIDASLASA